MPGIGAKVVEQFVDGHKVETLEGPEQDRFKLAQKVEAFLTKPDETTELLREIKSELKAAADFGEFNLELGDDAPYPETIAINVMKRCCTDGEECNCACHTGMVNHCAPCCDHCRYCGRNIRLFFFDEHKKECKKRYEATEADEGRRP